MLLQNFEDIHYDFFLTSTSRAARGSQGEDVCPTPSRCFTCDWTGFHHFGQSGSPHRSDCGPCFFPFQVHILSHGCVQIEWPWCAGMTKVTQLADSRRSSPTMLGCKMILHYFDSSCAKERGSKADEMLLLRGNGFCTSCHFGCAKVCRRGPHVKPVAWMWT